MAVPTPPSPIRRRGQFWLMLLLLCAVLGFVFAKSFQPGQTLFLNDGPLGSLKSDAAKLPDSFKGVWQDLNWIGMNGASALPSLTFLKFWLLGPVGYTKFHAPIAMVFLGLCAWLAFRQLGFRPLVCLLGGLAASLNSDLLSNACWGLSSRPLALATAFLTIAVLVTGRGPRGWFGWLVKCGLAGLTVGLGVVDAADVGAIFSLFLAAFAFVYSLTEEGSPTVNAVKGIARVAVMAAFALLMSMQIITGLIQAKVLGSEGVGAQQAKRSWQQNYDLATQWSLPKMESLRVIIPGLYGYLMTTPDGGQYWGGVGRSPQWQPSFGPNGARHSGAGEYAGVLVVLLAGWALAQSFRKKGSLVYTPAERKMIWFWGAMAAVALLASFGRHAPFYRLIFSLPYFNTVRNPIKWLHPLHLSLLMLFGYGLHGLCKAYLERAVTKTASLSAQLKAWWSNPTPFEKKWTILSVLTGAAGLLSWLVYSSSGEVLMRHLKETGFSAPEAESIARFSAGEVGLFVVFLAASVAMVILILSGAFAGPRAKWAGGLLGLILVLDLVRANAPWVNHYDYHVKYQSNPVVDILKDRPYEHRVAAKLAPLGGGYLVNQSQPGELFFKLEYDWLQNIFPYYNIQSLDVAQMPRVPEFDDAAFQAFAPTDMQHLEPIGRLWQLTNTRYVFGMAGFLDVLNQQIDPQHRSFTIRARFDLAPRPGIALPRSLDDLTVAMNDQGLLALFEFGAALPRAKLYSRWQVNTNNADVLKELLNPAFDPAQVVLMQNEIPGSAAATNQTAGSVEFTSYSSRRLQLHAKVETPSVLLLNDKYDPAWTVTVDGQPTPLLRANYLMRAVQLAPGDHRVEMRFAPPVTSLYSSIAALALGAVLLACLVLAKPVALAPAAPAVAKPPGSNRKS